MPLDITPAELEDLRRRAGITRPNEPQPAPGEPTASYRKLNPEPITVQLSPADLSALIAALELIEDIRGLPTVHYLIRKFKELGGRLPIRLPPENPYAGTAALNSE